jgi:hypothetical protein
MNSLATTLPNGTITTEFNLANVYRMDEPATFNSGHCRLDYIMCSVPLLSTVMLDGQKIQITDKE